MGLNYTGIFTYDEAKSVYKSQDTICEKDSDCIDGSFCSYSSPRKCFFSCYCNESDMNRCAIQRDLLNQCVYNDYQCREDYRNKTIQCFQNDDCLSNKCDNNKCIGAIYEVTLDQGKELYGVPRGEECNEKTICYGGKCRDGFCGPHDSFPAWIAYLIIGGISLICIVLICMIIRVCIKKIKNKSTV